MKIDMKAVSDAKRLDTLRSLLLLDSPAEEAFDRLTRLASAVLDVPTSLVSLVEADRQFFKSFFGVSEPWASLRQTPLSHSYCQYVVATGEPLIVEDARLDPLLCDNPAIQDMNAIGYLGMPLTTSDGVTLGSFCVVDTKPHAWTAREIRIIRELAHSAMTEIELRVQIFARERAERELELHNYRLQRLFYFAQITLNQIDELLERGTTMDELRAYVKQGRGELDDIRQTM